MNYELADSRTGLPFKIERASRKQQAAHQTTLLDRFFKRLGWRRRPDENPDQQKMKELTILVPCIAAGKPRKKGEIVQLENLKAAELIALKVAELKSDLPARLQPWEKARAKPVGEKIPAKAESVVTK